MLGAGRAGVQQRMHSAGSFSKAVVREPAACSNRACCVLPRTGRLRRHWHAFLTSPTLPASPSPPQQAEYFWEQARDVDIGFVRVAGAALALSVHKESLEWGRALAAAMKEVDDAAAAALRAKMAAMRAALAQVGVAVLGCAAFGGWPRLPRQARSHPVACRRTVAATHVGLRRAPPTQDPSSLDELKGVLAVVAGVHTDSMVVELAAADLEERCRTRLLYAVSGWARRLPSPRGRPAVAQQMACGVRTSSALQR